MQSSNSILIFLLFGTLVTIILAAPSINDLSNSIRVRQDDGDDDGEATTFPTFGPQIAQIITGALTGDLTKILAGSFNLVEDQEVKEGLTAGLGTALGEPSSTEKPVIPEIVTAPPQVASAPPSAPVPNTSTPIKKVAPAPKEPAAPQTVTESVVEPETVTAEAEAATTTEESIDVDVVTTIRIPSSTFFDDDDEAEAGSFVDLSLSK